jgi:hypothetical protein
MSKRRALDLVRALGKAEAALRGQEFLAPLLHGSNARLRIQGLIYEFRVPNSRPGWWICHVMDARYSEIIAPALPWQRGEYLSLWPDVSLVLVQHLINSSWLALPYYLEKQETTPIIVHLVEVGQPFERIIGRVEGKTVWYDDIDRNADPAIAEQLRSAFAQEKEQPEVRGLSKGEQIAYAILVEQARAGREQRALRKHESQVRDALETGGASLVGIERSDGSLRVTWDRQGHRSVTLIDPDLTVVSAGICLSGEDDKFDLTSVIGVVLDSPWYRHE